MKKTITILLFMAVIGILLTNCEKDATTIQPQEEILLNESINEPKIENFSLKDLSTDDTFNDLTSTYGILQPQFNTKTKSKSINSILDSLNISIDPNTIKKISSNGYISYTMLMIEPDDKSKDFSNLVIQEKDGIKRIFTIRYKQNANLTKTKSSSNTPSSAYSYDDVSMQSGMNPHYLWEDDSDDGGGSGNGGSNGCEEYTTVCNTVNVWVETTCGCGHWGNDPCDGCNGVYAGWTINTQEECEDVCVAENYPDPPNDPPNDGWTSNGPGTSSTGDNTDPTNVATSPVNPNGSSATADAMNNTLSQNSPFNVDVTKVLDSINLPSPDSTKIANEKFLCVYEKLTTSSSFKNLFVNTFGSSENFNVTFEIVDDLPDDRTGETGATSHFTNGNFTGIDITIRIDKPKLLSRSAFSVARTILHESIHAYLKLKLRDCNAGTSLDYINNLTLGETIKEFYDNFTCHPPDQSQHEFMFDYMMPTFKSVFTEIGYANLTSQAGINAVENYNLKDLNFLPGVSLTEDYIFNWKDFYYYFSLEGLHNTEAFKNEIENDQKENSLYNAFRNLARDFSKDCK